MNLDTVVKQIASGELQIRDDEYIGENGLPYCKNCKTERSTRSAETTLRTQKQCGKTISGFTYTATTAAAKPTLRRVFAMSYYGRVLDAYIRTSQRF